MNSRTFTGRAPAFSATDLLAWYDRNARQLPWRTPPHPGGVVRPDAAYRVWLSEIMLQQTTIKTVTPYYRDFLARWPDIDALAAAEEDQVLRRWAGLGYYSRARNLHKCARLIVAQYEGIFPSTAERLQALPGIGPYTAAAIAAISFGQAIAVVDGNVERVAARLLGLSRPVRESKGDVRTFVQDLVPTDRPGDFAQAMMDLGATLCTPHRPGCQRCPWADGCTARQTGTPDAFPVKAARQSKPIRRGAAFVVARKDGAVLLRRRPPNGLLGSMTEVPGSPWTTTYEPDSWRTHAPLNTTWSGECATVRHTFTHFHLVLDVYCTTLTETFTYPESWWFSPPGDWPDEALPSVMRKVLRAALS